MAELSRRGFIKQTSVSAATVGALATVPGLGIARAAAQVSTHQPTNHHLTGPLVAHVRNAATGEIAIYVDTREVVIHDPELVARLVEAVR